MQPAFHLILSLPAPIWSIFIVILSAFATASLIILLLPVFRRYALARPNARSSHHIPTPQGGGFAVLLVTYVLFFSFFALNNTDFSSPPLFVMICASLGLLVIGGIDDIRPLPALPRFLLQCGLIATTIVQLPDEVRLLPEVIPLPLEHIMIGLALVWFVNLVNFMDGIDLITTSEMLPLWSVIVLFAALNQDLPLLILSLCLIGALLGFVPFNWPIARLFLGDIGSLPLGLLSGWALLQFAYHTSLLLALIPALYYLSDATLTLIRRLLRGEKIWQAHRSHFYQRACQNNQSVLTVVSMIAATNVLLLIITAVALVLRSFTLPWLIDSSALLVACVVVTLLLRRLGKKVSAFKPPDQLD